MKKILIIHTSMEIGGVETSLLGLLNAIDYKNYQVDLLLLNPIGDLMNLIPREVNILDKYKDYSMLTIPIRDVIKNKKYLIAMARLLGKIKANIDNIIMGKKCDLCYVTKLYSHKIASKYLHNVSGDYDLGISFIDPHYILQDKVSAKVKLGWLHTDFDRINVNKKVDFKMWKKCDYIVSVSEACKESFDKIYPKLKEKSIVIENILSPEYIIKQSMEADVSDDIPKIPNTFNFCSIGRFCDAKNFDNVPTIARIIVEFGYSIKWYLIGYGSDEKKIRDKIKQENMDNNVIILGKKSNPYPYIRQCDFYIQPSRYEGKAVTVREAQILNKPVIITDYPTSKAQLEDKVDGIIVKKDNYECAKGIISFLNNKKLIKNITINTKNRDYSNKKEIDKIYEVIR